jgi:hypothetical protein
MPSYHRAIACIAVALSMSAAGVQAAELAQATPAAARAGVAAAVRGEVQLVSVPGGREIGKAVASGDPIFLGDRITTGSEGRLQIMLLDETVFTIGPNAAMVIDQFVYDPQTSAGKVTATVLKGTFRFVTGKVAKREPSDMEVKLPVGSIGVRGTSVAGETDGTRATVVLLGPGPQNDASERVGRVLVNGVGPNGSTTTVEVVRPGFATDIAGANQPPSPPVRLDPARLAALTAPLAGTAPRPPGPPAPAQAQQGSSGQSQQQSAPTGQAADQSGNQTNSTPAASAPGAGAPPPSLGAAGQAIGTGPSPVAQSGAGLAGGFTGIGSIDQVANPKNSKGRPDAQAAPDTKFLADVSQTAPGVPDGIPTREQLRTLGGTATVTVNGISLTPVNGAGSGTVNYHLSIDFGSRTTQSTLNGTYNLNGAGSTINFTDNGGNGFGNGTGQIDVSPSVLTNANAGLQAGHTGSLTEIPRNLNGKIAAILDIKLNIFDGATCQTSTNCVSGSRSNVPRTP